jgi:hypothetical protein
MTRPAKRLAALEQQGKVNQDQSTITSDWVMQQLKEIALSLTVNPSARVKALELLGRQLEMWDDQPDKDDNALADFVEALRQVRADRHQPEA